MLRYIAMHTVLSAKWFSWPYRSATFICPVLASIKMTASSKKLSWLLQPASRTLNGRFCSKNSSRDGWDLLQATIMCAKGLRLDTRLQPKLSFQFYVNYNLCRFAFRYLRLMLRYWWTVGLSHFQGFGTWITMSWLLSAFSFEYSVDTDVHKTEVVVIPPGRIHHIAQLVHLIIEAHGTWLL